MTTDCQSVHTDQVKILEHETAVTVEQKHHCGLFDDHLGPHLCKSCGKAWR